LLPVGAASARVGRAADCSAETVREKGGQALAPAKAVGRYDTYRKEAAFCEAMAEKAPTSKMRADWLRLAGRWLSLIPHRGQPCAVEHFEAMLQIKGTGQKNSKSSH
jgi:hypothetical protein